MRKVAIIGAGHMGRVHGTVYAEMPNAEPVAFVDCRLDGAEELAKSFGAQAFTDFDEMLRAANPDVIDVCVPTPCHKEYVIKAAEAGKHVVTEKPMAPSLADCREMIAATEKAGVTFMIAHVLRFFPEFVKAKAQIDAGAVGNPAVIRTTRGGGFPTGTGRDWYADFAQSGGVVLDLIIHDFDWLRWTFGEVDRVFAKGLVEKGIPRLDYALVTLRMKSGAIAHVEGTWANPGGFRVKFEVAGDKGMLDFQSENAAPLKVASTKAGAAASGVAIPESPTGENPYYLELEHFIECIETGRKPMISPEDGMRAVEISLAALESIKTGKLVKL